MEMYLGSIIWFAGPYEPVGFAFCDGRRLDVKRNQALFALIGPWYGGSGPPGEYEKWWFQLPDLRPKDASGEPRPWEANESSVKNAGGG